MSTKIYDVFEYTGTLASLMEKLVEWKELHFEHAVKWALSNFDCKNFPEFERKLRYLLDSDLIINQS